MESKATDIYLNNESTEKSVLGIVIGELDQIFYESVDEFKSDLPEVEPFKFRVTLTVEKVDK